jgi:hypothetical protein
MKLFTHKLSLSHIQRFVLLFACLLTFRGQQAFAQKWGKYTLVATQSTTAKLVDTAGTTYKTWTLSGTTGYSSYMLEGGVLLRTVTTTNSVFSGGGMHGRVQKVNWAGTVIWDYTYSTTTYCAHHDICPLPNGNVLMIAYELKSAAEVSAAGCSSSITMWPDKIVEVQPTGATTGTIVWEWHAWDHLVQNVSSSKANYQTSITDHPELMNINYTPQKEWMHMNGLDYNPVLDQIVFSCHNLNEIYVIDHSTTTAQAASHTGGNSGKGGDILYRWGNPASYGMTGTTNFNVVHDAHWIPAGVPRAGTLVGFNNGATTASSAADYFYPPYNGYNYTFVSGSAYAPATYDKRVVMNGKTSNMGNSQQLPNGNVLYCVALSGKIYEIDSNGNQLWTYSTGGTTPQASRYSDCYINGPSSVTATTSAAIVCKGSSTQLSSAATGNSTITYAWTSNVGGFTSSLQNPVVSPTANTIYTVVATSNGCTTTNTVTVAVNPKPITSAITGDTIVVPSAAKPYSVTSTSGSSYNWIVQGGTIQSGANTNNVTIKWGTINANNTLKLVEINASGCVGDTVTLAVTIAGSATLAVSPTTMAIANTGNTKDLIITSNLTWTIVSNQTWVTTNKTGGSGNDTLQVTINPNAGILNRTATLTITAGSLTQTVTISQDSSPLSFNVTPLNLSYPKSAGTKQLNIAANANWSASTASSWIVLSKTSGTETDSMIVTVTENTDTTRRTGTVILTSGNSTKTVTVTQDSTPVFINVTPGSLSFSNAVSSTQVKVTGSAAWTVTGSQSWLTLSKTSGASIDSLTVSVSANTSMSSRTATLLFKSGSASYSLTVTQNSTTAALAISTSSINMINSGETKGFAVTSNVSWTVSTSLNWVTANKLIGSGNDSIYLTTTNNTSMSRRSGTVVITAGSLTQTLNLGQDSTPAYLSVDQNSIQALQPGTSSQVLVSSNTNWTVSSNQTWVTAGKSSGSLNDSVTIMIAANNTYATRTATVSIQAGAILKAIIITQAGLDIPDSLSINQTNLNVNAFTNTGSINVISNRSWTISNPASWIVFTPASGTGNAAVSYTISENTGLVSRSASVVFTAGGLTQTLQVIQGSYTLTVATDTLSSEVSGSTNTVLITSNRKWTAVSDQTWATLSTNSDSGSVSLSITTAANTGVTRYATITITAGPIIKTLVVKQSGVTTGFDETKALLQSVSMYPNPTTGMVYFDMNGINEIFHISIYDTFGKRIRELTDEESADLSGYATGVYIVNITTESGVSTTRKLILSQ